MAVKYIKCPGETHVVYTHPFELALYQAMALAQSTGERWAVRHRTTVHRCGDGVAYSWEYYATPTHR